MSALKFIQDHASQGGFWLVWPFVSVLIIGAAIYCRRPLKPHDWHPWFAWRPVRIGGRWRWLCWLERRFNYNDDRELELRAPPPHERRDDDQLGGPW